MWGFRSNGILGDIGFSADGSSAGYLPEAEAIFTAMSVPPDDTRKALINTAVTSFISASLWTGFDTMFFLAAHDEQAGRINWVNPLNVMTVVGAPLFTTDRGFEQIIGSDYLTTGYFFGSGTNYTLDNASQSVYINQAVIANNTAVCGVRKSTVPVSYNYISNATGGGADQGFINQNSGGLSINNLAWTGFIEFDRSGATTVKGYLDGLLASTNSTVSTALPNLEDYILKANNNGSSTVGGRAGTRVAARTVGRSFTDGEHATIRTIVQTYLTAIGAQV